MSAKAVSSFRGILHDIDERLEGLQDELDFREARISKAGECFLSVERGW